MIENLRYAREVERMILAAIAEDRGDIDLAGLIEDLELTYAEIFARLRRRSIAAPAYLERVLHAGHTNQPINEGILQ